MLEMTTKGSVFTPTSEVFSLLLSLTHLLVIVLGKACKYQLPLSMPGLVQLLFRNIGNAYRRVPACSIRPA